MLQLFCSYVLHSCSLFHVWDYLFLLVCSVCVYGGGDRKSQIDSLRKGVEIVIGQSISSSGTHLFIVCIFDVH